MATIKSYTDYPQSKVLSKILSYESADMYYSKRDTIYADTLYDSCDSQFFYFRGYTPCWSLAALLNILHNKTKDIPSLSGGGYKAGKYTSDWCLDYEFENGDYKTTFADNPVDACYNMIIKLNELKML